jgi:hypothetical protein
MSQDGLTPGFNPSAPSAGTFGASTGGGLQSSPLVPRAGATIDPATGQPHKEGLTRAELHAKREAEAAAKAAEAAEENK